MKNDIKVNLIKNAGTLAELLNIVLKFRVNN